MIVTQGKLIIPKEGQAVCSFWRYRNPRIGLQSLWWLLFFLQRNSLQFANLAQLVNSVRRGPACCSTLTARLFCFFPFHSEFTVCLQDRLFYQDDIKERLIQLPKRKEKENNIFNVQTRRSYNTNVTQFSMDLRVSSDSPISPG